MQWYSYIALFFAGAFIGNTVPHLVQGVSGNKFPTPFAKPPGKGLSSSLLNVIWALVNMLISYGLAKSGHFSTETAPLCVSFAGLAAISIIHSLHFPQKHKE